MEDRHSEPTRLARRTIESEFEVTRDGSFMQRWGAGKAEGATHSNKKLCMVATDQMAMADVLLALSHRPDCSYVAYSTQSKDGMFLGLCFVVDEATAGKLWQQLKQHPHLMCMVQDDDFIAPFRT